jgi:hypothetical protein
MKNLLVYIVIQLLAVTLYAQIGGNGIYKFLDLSNSARISALGGKNVSLNDNDLNMAVSNPALLTEGTNQNIALNYVRYYANINYGYAGYSMNVNSKSSLGIGMQYVNYGAFDGADVTGRLTGQFRAADYACNIIYSLSIDSFWRVGTNVKPVYSVYESYTSVGLATDLGLTYTTSDRLTSAGLVLRNIGTEFYTYSGNAPEPLAFEIQLGYTQKLEHAPFRFSITAHQLQRYNLRFDKPGENEPDPFTGETPKVNKIEQFADNAMRHLIFGAEFVPSKNFWIGFAYNYQRRVEMQVKQKGSMEGFSIGAGIRVSRFNISYGRAQYHLSGSTNIISVSTNLGSW